MFVFLTPSRSLRIVTSSRLKEAFHLNTQIFWQFIHLKLALVYNKIISSGNCEFFALLPESFKEHCFYFQRAALLCIKFIVPQPQLCFPRTLLLLTLSPQHHRGLIKSFRQCQQRCGGMAPISRVLRFVRYLCQVVFIRARMRPICRLGCPPPPSSRQVFCAVLCVTVGAWLLSGEVADCFRFSQNTEWSSAQLMWINTCARTCVNQVCMSRKLRHKYTHTHAWNFAAKILRSRLRLIFHFLITYILHWL